MHGNRDAADAASTDTLGAQMFAAPVLPREELVWPEMYRRVRQLTEEEEWERLYADLRPGNWD